MSRNGKSSGRGFTYKNLSDESGDGSDEDGVALVMTDSDSPREGSSRKYVVSKDDDGKLSICKPHKFTQNERICIIIGCLILAAVLILLVVIIIVTQLPGSELRGGGSGNTNTSGGNGSGVIMPWEKVRLPEEIAPTHYDINLNVNMQTFAVSGNVNVTCTVKNETRYILIHAKDMEIGPNIHVQSQIQGYIKSTGTVQPENDFYVLELSTKLQPGTIYIHLPFNYILRDELYGFYKSSYVNDMGQKRFLATTQFEPTDARSAFPCFDEPAFKASFTMHITHDSGYHAVSNMPPVNFTDNTDGTVTTHFNTSVKMSTYLVAFIVSDFVCVNDSISEGHATPLKVCVERIDRDRSMSTLREREREREKYVSEEKSAILVLLQMSATTVLVSSVYFHTFVLYFLYTKNCVPQMVPCKFVVPGNVEVMCPFPAGVVGQLHVCLYFMQ